MGIWQSFKSKMSHLGGILGRAINKGVELAPKIGGVLNRVGGGIGGTIGTAMQTAGGILNKVPGAVDWIKRKFGKRRDQVRDVVNRFKDKALEDARNAKTHVLDEATKLKTDVAAAVHDPSINTNVGIVGGE